MSTVDVNGEFAEAGRAALAALARADADRGASGHVESALMHAFDAQHANRHSDWRRWMALAAALVLAVGTAVGWLGTQRFGAKEDARSVAGNQRSDDLGPSGSDAEAPAGAFVPWPGAAVLPAFERGELVRTTLPATVLPLLGLPPVDAPADGHVTADVLYGQDGYPRAVRVVGLRP